MSFNLVEMYNGLLRFNKHILNELAEGLKHLPNLDGVSKGDSLIINEQGNSAWGSTAFIPTFENAAYGIEWTKRTGISYDEANEFCTNRGDWITMIDYLEYCALQALCYIEYANFDNQAALNTNFIGDQANTDGAITEFDFRFGPYFVPNKVGTNKKADYNSKRGNDGQDTDKAVRVLLLDGGAHNGSWADSGFFYSNWVRSASLADVGFFTTVKLD